MPLFNITAKNMEPFDYVVQKVDEGKALRTVLSAISKRLNIPSMDDYVAFACGEKKQPVARLDMDIPLEEQGVLPQSYIYVSPIDSTPKGPNGEELPLALDLKKMQQKSEQTEEEEKEAAVNKQTEQQQEEEPAKKPTVRICDDAAAASGSPRHAVNAGDLQPGNDESPEAVAKVQINLVPDVIGVAVREETSNNDVPRSPGKLDLRLAEAAKNSPLQHTVLVRLADFLLSKRPSRPQIALWSHLQSKQLGSEADVLQQKKEDRRRSAPSSLTFAPVGNTAEERLASGAPAGPARATLRHWARLILESKPDNPALAMWLKLEARMEREPLGISFSRVSTGLGEDSTKMALLRGIPRGTVTFVVMRGLVEALFEKKPEMPEVWMLYHLVSRLKSSGPASGRSSVMSFRVTDDDHRGDESGISDAKDIFADADGEFRRFSAILANPGSELLTPSPNHKRDIHMHTKHVSTQTSQLSNTGGVVGGSAQATPLMRVRRASSAESMNLLREPTPRECLQVQSSGAPSLIHRRVHTDIIASDPEHYRESPLRHVRHSSLSDPPQYTGSAFTQQSHAYRTSCVSSRQNDNSASGREENSDESYGCASSRWGVHSPIAASENRQRPPLSGNLSSSETPELQYAIRRCEVERAETLHEYNWLLQREMLRNEQLQREIELLRYEKEARDRMIKSSPIAHLPWPTGPVARSKTEAEAEAEAPLREFKLEDSPWYPSELDIIRKRLELLDMEEARFRHLSQSPNSSRVCTANEVVGDAAIRASSSSPALHHSGNRVGISPHFDPVVRVASKGATHVRYKQ